MKLKTKLLSCAMALSLLGASPAMAIGDWTAVTMGTIMTIHAGVMFALSNGGVVWMTAINTDPLQIIAEAGVLYTMKHITDKWQPEPATDYQQAAADNGRYEQMEFIPENGLENPMNFQVAALQNVGIEALNIGPDLSSILSARNQILSELEYFQPKPSNSGNSTSAEAGTCSATYSICKKALTTTQKKTISANQVKNEQWYGTAGIAHAELGLKAVQQAIVDDGGSLTKEDTSPTQNGAITAFGTTTGKNMAVQDLSGLIGTGRNTYNAMKIVAMMNLELAQRLNEGNMLQGSTLVIEAARAFPRTSDILN